MGEGNLLAHSRKRNMSKHTKSQRQLRVGELLRHALADIVAREKLHEADLHGAMLTITEVTVSPDLKSATAFCSLLGGGDIDGVIASLNGARREIRRHLGASVSLKFTPDIKFKIDRTLDQASAIDALLNSPRVAKDLQTKKQQASSVDDDDADV